MVARARRDRPLKRGAARHRGRIVEQGAVGRGVARVGGLGYVAAVMGPHQK